MQAAFLPLNDLVELSDSEIQLVSGGANSAATALRIVAGGLTAVATAVQFFGPAGFVGSIPIRGAALGFGALAMTLSYAVPGPDGGTGTQGDTPALLDQH